MNIFITGGTRGIGKSLVEAFSRNYNNVFFCFEKEKDNALSLEEKLISEGFFAKGIKADVSDANQVLKAVEEAKDICGNIDVLINNAGISLVSLIQDTTEEEFDRLFSVNVKGVYNCIKAVLPDMLSKKKGHIINISSIFGISGASMEALYSATKAAVIGLTKSLALELGPSGITVNCIAPGVIDTDMNNNLSAEEKIELINRTSARRLGKGEDIASLALFLADEKNSFITGQTISVDGGLV